MIQLIQIVLAENIGLRILDALNQVATGTRFVGLRYLVASLIGLGSLAKLTSPYVSALLSRKKASFPEADLATFQSRFEDVSERLVRKDLLLDRVEKRNADLFDDLQKRERQILELQELHASEIAHLKGLISELRSKLARRGIREDPPSPVVAIVDETGTEAE